MSIPPPDAKVNSRAELARFRAAIDGRRHWLLGTDDPVVAVALRILALRYGLFDCPAAGVLLFEAHIFRVASGDILRLTALAVPKALLSRDEVAAVVGEITGSAPPTTDNPGADRFIMGLDPDGVSCALERIREGTTGPYTPNAN